MIYLDNGATSFPKPRGMTMEMENCLLNYCGNPGRSGHDFSIKTGEEVYEARLRVAKVFNIEDPSRLIFTKNTTESLNQAIRGYLFMGDHVITTAMEHNSVLRPLKELEAEGIEHTIVRADKEGRIKASQIENAIKENTKLIVMTGAANVTGTIMPFREVGSIARKHQIAFLMDGAQCAGCMPIDIQKDNIDMLAFPGHKGLLGPQGTGGLYIKEGIELRPILAGGTGTESRNRSQPRDLPEGFEAGTVNSPGIIGLGYSSQFIRKIGIETIEFHEKELIKIFDEGIGNMEFVVSYGPNYKEKCGISLFNIKGIECEEVTDTLNSRYGIAVRGGYHCAGLAHKTIGTWDTGAIRLSVGPFNTRKDIKQAIDAIWQIGKNK